MLPKNHFKLAIISFGFLLSSTFYANGQSSTWGQIHAIFQTSCAGSSCHSVGASHPLTLIGNESDVYNNLLGVTPTNTDAAARGYKLVDPGYPHYSFLLKKVNNGLDPDNDPDGILQGVNMPTSAPPLSNAQIDLIHAWIINGAPQTGDLDPTQLINDFHSIGGIAPQTPPPAPDPADGFQIHYGPIFIAPGQEDEFFKKHKMLNIPDSVEITRLESFINFESHHFILYKFDDVASANAVTKEGLRKVSGIGDAFTQGASMVEAWQNSTDIPLPENTAYFWEGDPILDLDLHIRNYSQDSILKADVYTNVYTRPIQSTTTEMISDLILYSVIPYSNLFPCSVQEFCIPNDAQDHTFTGTVTSADLPGVSSSDSIYVWLISSHTHKFGTDYFIFERTSSGNKGDTLYNGRYNFTYTFNQGYYDYEDPAVRYFDLDTMPIRAGDGFIHEATFNNDSTTDVGFGITTNDEMMLMFLQYTKQRPLKVGVVETAQASSSIKMYPNPAAESTQISVTGSEIDAGSKLIFELYDILGKELISQPFPTGQKHFYLKRGELPSGIYIYTVQNNGQIVGNGKLILY